MPGYAFAVIGGDLRMAWLAQLLTDDSCIVKLFGHEENEFPFSNEIIHCSDIETALAHCDACLLGLPCSRDSKTVFAPFSYQAILLSELVSLLTPDQLLIGGILPNLDADITTIDYSIDESFILYNTIPTAEGALQLLMEHSPDTVFGSSIAIVGFGRVAQQTAQLLRAAGAYVTVFARSKEARTKAEILGFGTGDISNILHNHQRYNSVLNTVPKILFSSDSLQNAEKHTLFMELASSPGGFDMDTIRQKHLLYIPAGGLPGKVAPRTAAKYIKNTILNRLEELK